MKWWIAIFVAALASAVQAQAQTAVQVVKHATGTLDYENFGAHDCKPGIEVPVRFVAKNVGVEILRLEPMHTIRIMRGLEYSEYQMPNSDLGKSAGFPDSGFILDVDVIFCIGPVSNNIPSGRWKVWHGGGEDKFTVSGALPSGNRQQSYISFRNVSNMYLVKSPDGRNKYISDDFGAQTNRAFINVFISDMDFPSLHNVDGGLSHIISAKATIKLESANTSEEVSND